MPTATDYRRELDRLADSLQRTVITPMKAAWTPAVRSAAKSVADVAPDALDARATRLLEAFAAYRPLVESTPPRTDRTRAIAAVDDAVAALQAELGSTTRALVAAKEFKTTDEKASIDRAKDALDGVAVALTTWRGSFHLFDESVTTSGGGGGGDGQTLTTWTTIANGTPYDMTIAVRIADDRDWASSVYRPDRTFAGANGAPMGLGRFGRLTKRSDLDVAATTAKFTVTATVMIPGDPIDGLPEATRVVVFTLDQAAVKDVSGGAPTSGSGEPIAPFFALVPRTGSGAATYVVMQGVSERPDRAPELVAILSDDRGV